MRRAHGQGEYNGEYGMGGQRKPEEKLPVLAMRDGYLSQGERGKNFPSCTFVLLGTKAQFFHHLLTFFT